jgi:uncharacterized protein (DUF2141 family)
VKLFAIASLATLAALPALAADVTVRVTGIADSAGQIRVAACTEAEFLKTCRLAASAPARAGEVTVTLRAVPAGRYAIQVFHDRNGDGQLATNLIGMPSEPFGFSRAPAMRFGPPAFADSAVEIDTPRMIVPVALRS